MKAIFWLGIASLSLLMVQVSARAGTDDGALDVLVKAYPDQLAGHDASHIYWRDGTAMAVSDGQIDKSFRERLLNASILDQLRLPYPRGTLASPPPQNADPGRFRNQPFFLKMYGDCRKGQAARHLVPIIWLPKTWGHRIWITDINGLPEKLRVVSAEIDALPRPVRAAAYPPAGIFACRAVKDTGRLSMHAFAAAIDLNVAFSDYWLWHRANSPGDVVYRNRMPQRIVDVFERNGFIWGGKWYHYDTMHFEYRPELLATSPSR
jgi:D-alanyl-D-alanine carboxypeptidase